MIRNLSGRYKVAVGITVGVAMSAVLLYWHHGPEDRVYRIGADHSPPYYSIANDGTITGLGVDVLNEAARRARIRLEWIPVEGGRLDDVMRAGTVDLWPAVATTPQREWAYFSSPWLKNNFCLLQLADRVETSAPVVVSYRPGYLIEMLARRHLPEYRPIVMPSREAALEAVCARRSDATLVEARFLDTALLNRPAACAGARFRVKVLPGATSELRIMAQPRYAPAADALRGAINTMAGDGALANAIERWSSISSTDAGSVYALQESENRGRLYRWAALACLLFAGVMVVQWRRIRAANVEASEARLSAERANQAKSDFLANMSHEIRTPLNGVIGLAALLLDSHHDDRTRSDIATIHNSAQALLGIINDVLDLSKIEAGKITIEKEPFDLEYLLLEIAGLFKAEASQRGLALSMDYAAGVPKGFEGDPLRIRQIVSNLVSNAIKFTHAGSISIQVSRQQGNRVRISVSDTGIGISEEALSRLFTKFTQAHASTTRLYGGTGLGLAICRKLAGLMSGEMGVKSKPGEGSTFWVELPLPVLETVCPFRPQRPEARLKGAGRGLRALVAEDNNVNRELLRRLLTRRGMLVDAVENGAEAVEAASQTRYDIIFMDCQMPVMDGMAATARIRARETGAPVPIVAVTASLLDADIGLCRKAGMDDHMSKPIQVDELNRCLATYCSTNPTAS